MDSQFRRNPEQLLREIEQQERRERRGRLKIFLGTPPALENLQRCSRKVCAGANAGKMLLWAPSSLSVRREIDRLLAQHEIIPTLKVGDRQVIDIERILCRHPQVVVIDGCTDQSARQQASRTLAGNRRTPASTASPWLPLSICTPFGNFRTNSGRLPASGPPKRCRTILRARRRHRDYGCAGPGQSVTVSGDGAVGGGRGR